MALHVVCSPLPDLATLAPRWQALEAQSDGRLFLGWGWTGSWLAASGARPDLVAIGDDAGHDVALCLLGSGSEKRLLGAVPTLWLNESGDALADRVFIEHNGLLCRCGMEAEARAAFAGYLAGRKGWKSLRLAGLAPGDPLPAAIAARRRMLVDAMPAYGIDLAAVRAADGDYPALLSANTRQQLRRAARCHAGAQVTVRRAVDAAEVASLVAAMASLNAGRHDDNAWDLPMFRDFCRRLAVAGLDAGSVDLLIVSAGGSPIGYLLNLVESGRAMNYQSAFAAPRDGKDKPGLLAHAAAVDHYARLGFGVYSLLAGRDRYKQSLGTMEERLEWWRVERFSPAQEAEYWLRRLLRR